MGRQTSKLPRCGCTLRVTSQTSYCCPVFYFKLS
jgi:hypothetical protein